MIEAIKVAGLRNNEFSQFLQNFLNMTQRFDPAILQVQDEYNALLAQSNIIQTMLNEASGSVITDDLATLDARRDDAINGIIAMVNANLYSIDAATKTAANLLSNHLAGFGPGIARDTLQSETSKLQKIAFDWNTKADLKAAVTLLNLDSWKAEMIAANTAFDTRYVDRSMETGLADFNADKVYNMRPQVNLVYYELRNQLNSYYTIKKKAAPWSNAIAALNGVIKDYNDLLSSRGSQGETDNGKATDAAA